MPTYLESPERKTVSGLIPGGEFVAEQDDVGKWVVRDVPILAEMKARDRSNEFDVDSKWMFQCIERHRQLERDNKHMPAVHEEHHDDGLRSSQIGLLRPTRVGRLRLDGKMKWALFADILNVDDWNLERLESLALPYRSIEINKQWRPEIASLALMPTESPHHKLPMLKVVRRVENPSFVSLRESDDTFVLTQTFTEEGDAVPATKKKGVKRATPDREKLADSDDEDEEDMAEGGGIEAKLQAIFDKFVSESLPGLLESALTSAAPAAVETEAAEEEDRAPAEAFKAEVEKLRDDKDALLEKLADALTRIDALEKKDTKREESDDLSSAVDSGLAELREARYNVDGLRSEIEEFAKLADDPKKGVEAFVKSHKKNVDPDPPEDLEQLGERGLITGAEEIDSLPKVVSKLREKGPDAFALAVTAHKSYLRAKERGASSTLEEFMQTEFELAGMADALEV